MVAFAQSIVEDLNRIVCEDREKQVHCLYNYAGCMESEWTQATQYLLSLLQELCWPISHLGNVGNGNQDHICDGDTRETDAKNIEVSQIHANYKKGSRQEVLHACILKRPLHRGGTMNNQHENAKGSDVKMYRKLIFATVEQLNKIIKRRIFFPL